MVAFDEHGGTYDDAAPPRVDPRTPPPQLGQMGFRFDRARVRIRTLAVAAHIGPKAVVTSECRSTSPIRAPREH